MSINDDMVFFTAICSVGERKQVLQFLAADPQDALVKWVLSMRRQPECILSMEVLNEMEKDFTEKIIEPVPCDGVISVWNCPDVIGDTLIDLVLVATASEMKVMRSTHTESTGSRESA